MKKILIITMLIFIGCDDTDNTLLNCSEGYVELWGIYYDIENTTELQITGLTGIIPPHISCLINLTYLSLSGDLTGEIPSEIGDLTNLKELHLDRNELSGEIPSEIGNLTNLEELHLHFNDFTGEIPSSIGNLTNLTFLRLYGNQLTGDIPQSVCNLIETNNLNIYTIIEYNYGGIINTCN